MVRLNVDQMSRYVSPVNPAAFPTLSIVLLGNEKRKILIERIIFIFIFRYWNIFNVMVFCLWSYKYKIYSGLEKRTYHCSVCGIWVIRINNWRISFVLVWHRFFLVMVVYFFYFGLEFMFKKQIKEWLTIEI